ncbi:MAG: AAA family ATPase [Candidatus Rokubacteria bacterium]|nr:AAA family ATPase [Candidatus Rokubacteria bacterium]
MRCVRCQEENAPHARFCLACGARLALACSACGTELPGGARFCLQCGQPVGDQVPPQARFASPEAYIPKHLAERILTSKSALEGERKQVTVLFADIKGSMELLADRDPEEARRLLDPVLERLMEAVHRYEGTVNQVMGDGIMALFGAPLAQEDHAVRACYAALGMQDAVGRYADELRGQGVDVQIRVGLNSGEVVVRSIGSDLRMDYSAVGQTTHLAARMEQLARPGTTLLTAHTLQHAEGYVQVRALGPIRIKGLSEPIEAYELAGASLARTRLQAAAGRGLSRFVGRDAEMEQLRRAQRAAAQGRGQVVAVVGEPGVGKSRLFWEFTRSHRTTGWLVLESSSVSFGKATPYLPVIDLLKGYFGIEDPDDTRKIREKVTGKVFALDRALEPHLPAFLALLHVPVDDEPWERLDSLQRRQRTVDAIRHLLLRESHCQPLCVVFEDLHWIDEETQAIVDSLVDGLPTARILLLVNYRPEYHHPWGSRTYYSQSRIDPLASESAEELLAFLLGDDPGLQPVKRLLIEQTEGNPFFLEESVRALIETKTLAGERGACRLAKPVEAIQVPATVQAVLAARIDRLPPDDKRLLQTAAVLGKDVPFTLLQAVVDVPEESLRRALGQLQAGEFLYEASLFPELQYTFKHALTHEVAYGSLLHERRRTLHARVAEVFETLHPDRVTEKAHWLSHHAFRGEAWSRALTYLRQTVEGAAPASLDAVLGGPESPGYFWWVGDYDRAIKVGERELAIAADFANPQMKVVSNFRLGQTYHSLGDHPRAMSFLRRNVESLEGELLYEHLGMAGLPSVFSRSWLAWCCAERGDFIEAGAVGEKAVQLAEAVDHPYSLIVACFALGGVHLLRGDLEKAIPLLERGLVVDQIANIPALFPFIASRVGYAYALSGQSGKGLSLLERAIDRATAMNLKANRSLMLAWLAESHLRASGSEPAMRSAEQALDLSRTQKERGHEARILWLLGEVASCRETPDFEAADARYQEARDLATELGMQPLVAHCHLGLGRLSRCLGKREQAGERLTTATTMYREMDMRFWLEQAEAEMKELG